MLFFSISSKCFFYQCVQNVVVVVCMVLHVVPFPASIFHKSNMVLQSYLTSDISTFASQLLSANGVERFLCSCFKNEASRAFQTSIYIPMNFPPEFWLRSVFPADVRIVLEASESRVEAFGETVFLCFKEAERRRLHSINCVTASVDTISSDFQAADPSFLLTCRLLSPLFLLRRSLRSGRPEINKNETEGRKREEELN